MPNGIAYDTDAGILVTSLRISQTIIPEVVRGFEFWILCALNVIVCICRHCHLFHPEDYDVNLPWGLTTATGSLMTFFVCFYNRHVFERYNLLYDISKRMEESCLEVLSFLKLSEPKKEVHLKVTKFLLTSCFLFFFERTGDSGSQQDDTDGYMVSKHEYDILRQFRLLDEFEISHLKRFVKKYKTDAIPSLVVLQWIMLLMRRVTPEHEGRDDFLVGLDDKLYVLRGSMADVSNIMELPMPFQYFHIMNMMLVLNLCLWAYALGCQDSIFAPLIYMFVQMMFQGIRELSTALSNPFGDDEVDFPLNEWMGRLYTRMTALLEDDYNLADLTIDGDKELKDPESTSRKINLLVDRDDLIQARKRRIRRRMSNESSLELLRSLMIGGEADDLESALELRREMWAEKWGERQSTPQYQPQEGTWVIHAHH